MPKSPNRRQAHHRMTREHPNYRAGNQRTGTTESHLLTAIATQTGAAVTALEQACSLIRAQLPDGQRRDAVLRRGQSAAALAHEFVTTSLQDLANGRLPDAIATALRQLQRLQTDNSASVTPSNHSADPETALLNSMRQTAELIETITALDGYYRKQTDAVTTRRSPNGKPSAIRRRTNLIRQYQAARADLRRHLRLLRRVLGQTYAMLRLLPTPPDTMNAADRTLHHIDQLMTTTTTTTDQPKPAPPV